MKNLLTYYITQFRYWFTGIPAVQRFQIQHPKVSDFISDRFSTRMFVGLPLTLLLLVGWVNVMLLSELTESVVDAEWVVVADQKFTDLLYSMRSDWLSITMFALTQLGEQLAVFVIGGIATLIFLFRKRYWAIIAFWLAMGGVGLSVRFAKTFISRARPADVAYYEVEHYSFPSGHATTAMALFGLLAYFLYRHNNSGPYRTLIAWPTAILILLVSFSRIYLGVHFLSDVLAGMLLGLLWMLVGVSLEEVMQYRRKRREV
ncbi:phosphatase PAP2 family protein [Pontibacter sp. KCTC 32443]|uniref:phosphatase PAP2 family protein n=1 Tax=Pontibacter TaxID=323449 RepID=UPI00164E342C|nr:MULTISPECIES: phosphatase PAP2 family protein [Pontibacter]MBC5776010.1 phosphatase PAP2 family protein [Pontibacter sp. KCTC 32443]